MISEKTVELNLTAELMNWFRQITGFPHYALAPSQRQEGRLGYDVAIEGGMGVLIQYKRAYVNGNVWCWHLNRTRRQDQHARLQALEARGFPVFYAFPYFHDPLEIRRYRDNLRRRTFWYRPSQINPPGGTIGHHDVRFDSDTGRWTVHSDPVEIPEPLTIYSVASELDNESKAKNLVSLIKAFNETVLGLDVSDESISNNPDSIELDDLIQGVSVIGNSNRAKNRFYD